MLRALARSDRRRGLRGLFRRAPVDARVFPARGRGLPVPDRVSLPLCRALLARARFAPAPFLERSAGPERNVRLANLQQAAPHVLLLEITAARQMRSKPKLSYTLHSAGSCFVPFDLRRIALRRGGLCGLLPFLELPADHSNFEQNPARLNLLANLFQLRRSDFIRAVGDIEKEAFEFVERVGHNF